MTIFSQSFKQQKDISGKALLSYSRNLSLCIETYCIYPSFMQTFIFNYSLRWVRNLKGSQIHLLQVLICLLNDLKVLPRVNASNLYFLQDSLLSHPHSPLLVLLYRHHFLLTQWKDRPFLSRLRGWTTLPDSMEAREVALMRELLEGAEAKLMLLWFFGKGSLWKVGRLPKYLLQDIVGYL